MIYENDPICPYCSITINNWDDVLSYRTVNGKGPFYREVICPGCQELFDIKVIKKYYFDVEPIGDKNGQI